MARLAKHGANVLAKDRRPGLARLLWRAVLNPLVILLAVLATISFATGDVRAAAMMLSMIVLSVSLKLVSRSRSYRLWFLAGAVGFHASPSLA
jgi:Mg2+-importing ATPase